MNNRPNLQRAEQMKFEFLRTEIMTGLTMSKVALEADQQDKVDRNRANARKAYDTALRFLATASLTNDEAQELKTKLAQLKSALRRLGEEV
jgi:hypothetical protein